jgi:hypothetical protein
MPHVLSGSSLAYLSVVTSNEAERIIEEWLEEEAQSAPLPYTERLRAPGYWALDGRFDLDA